MSLEKNGTVERLYKSIEEKLLVAFPEGFSIVPGSPTSRSVEALPAIYFSVVNMRSLEKLSSNELIIEFDLEAKLLFQGDNKAKIIARDVALSIATLLDDTFVEGMEKPMLFKGILDDSFDAIMTDYEALSINFEGYLRAGIDKFEGEEIYKVWAKALGKEVSL